MAKKKKSKQMEIEKYMKGDVVVTVAQKKGFLYLAGIPARAGDETFSIKDGILLCVKDIKDIWGTESYVMEIITGENASDLIYVATTLTDMMDIVPSSRRR